jgi:ABC-type xylose transport system permease subunit
MSMLRRCVLLAALMYWQGGFTFYAAAVVPIGSEVLGSHLSQGMITRRVAVHLNIAACVALVIWAWDIAAAVDAIRWRRRTRWGAWVFLVLALGVLVWMHPILDELFDLEHGVIVDSTLFRTLHRVYLYVCTAQWAGSLVLGVLTLLAWRDEDRRALT